MVAAALPGVHMNENNRVDIRTEQAHSNYTKFDWYNMKVNTLLRKYGAIGFAVSGKQDQNQTTPTQCTTAELWLEDYNTNLVFA